MKRAVLFLFLLSVISSPVFAQKNLFRSLLRWRTGKKAVVPAERELRIVQGKKFIPGVKPAIPAGQAEMERFVFHMPVLTGPEKLRIAFTPADRFQSLEIYLRYQVVMERFLNFKKEMDSFLFYQIRPGTRRELHTVERERILSRVMEVELELDRLTSVISPKDEAVSFARTYTNRVKMEVAPILKGTEQDVPRFERTDRVFSGDDFYLHREEMKRWLSMLRHGQARRFAFQLPKNLRIAVLNDRASVLEKMQASHAKGVFVRSAELDCFSSADELLFSIREQGRQYDLILTDIIMPGGGGYYITPELRLDGYEGAIIALSAFERDDTMALDMFERGFDGMLNLPTGFEFSPFWEADIMRGLDNYFRLRDKHHWRR